MSSPSYCISENESPFIQTYLNKYVRKADIRSFSVNDKYEIRLYCLKDGGFESYCHSQYNSKEEADKALKKLMKRVFNCKIYFE
jgi:hypothetical protein